LERLFIFNSTHVAINNEKIQIRERERERERNCPSKEVKKRKRVWLVVHTCNPSTQDAEAKGWGGWGAGGHPALHSQTLPQTKKKKRRENAQPKADECFQILCETLTPRPLQAGSSQKGQVPTHLHFPVCPLGPRTPPPSEVLGKATRLNRNPKMPHVEVKAGPSAQLCPLPSWKL
jgi:hypothetical protein